MTANNEAEIKVDTTEIAYVNIDTFKRATRKNYQRCSSIKEFMNIVKSNEATPNFAIYEILNNDFRRLYFDIENVPFDKPELINSLINDLAEFIGIDSNEYGLTLNTGSHHPGLSYHLTFPYKSHAKNILNLIRNFKLQYNDYRDYIDECVYNSNRLFRVPNQYGILDSFDRNVEIRGDFENRNNTTPPTVYDKMKDVHRIVKGKFEDMIIQNIAELPMLGEFYKNVPTSKLPRLNVSYPAMSSSVMKMMYEMSLGNQKNNSENIELMKENVKSVERSFNNMITKETIYAIMIFILVLVVLFKH